MDDIKIAVIGLGYVGLPLARLFSTKFTTVGFDMNQARVDALMTGQHSKLMIVCFRKLLPMVSSVQLIWKKFAIVISTW